MYDMWSLIKITIICKLCPDDRLGSKDLRNGSDLYTDLVV